MDADGRGWSWKLAAVGRPRKLPWQLPRTSADVRGDWPVAVTMAADSRRNCNDSFRGTRRGKCRGLPWVTMVGTTDCATDRTAARAVATTVAFCCGSAMSCGTCRGNPRISTVVRGSTLRKFHGHRRGPPPRSQIMCIRAKKIKITRANETRKREHHRV